VKKRIYLETTVVSYLTARMSRDLLIAGHQQATQQLWPMLTSEYETFISALVYQEASKGDRDRASKRLEAIKVFPMLEIDDEVRSLAEKIVASWGIPKQFPEDALHVAVAAVNEIEILVTWNFGHLSNPFTRRLIRKIVEREGYSCPEICSPDELLEDEK
jgi:hypothetical protein